MARRKNPIQPSADAVPPKAPAASKPRPDAPPVTPAAAAPRLRRTPAKAAEVRAQAGAVGAPEPKAAPPARTASPAPVQAKASKKAPTKATTQATIEAPAAPRTPRASTARTRTPAASRRQTIEPLAAASADAAARPPVESVLAAEPPLDSAPPIVPGEPPDRLSILMVASEVLPYAKTGGLADVAAALPAALAALGHQVVVAMPRYRGVPVSGDLLTTFVLDIGAEHLHVQNLPRAHGGRSGAVARRHPGALRPRRPLRRRQPRPPGQPAPVRGAGAGRVRSGDRHRVLPRRRARARLAGRARAVYLRTLYATHPVLGGVPSVFTIHNIAYTGACDAGWIPALDLDWDLYTPQALEYWGQVSLLKAGINFSEKVTTVSRRYAEEILTPEFAYGLEGVLASRRADLVGILG